MKKIFAIIMSFQLILSPMALAQEDAYTKTGSGSEGGYDFYMNQILVLGTSSVGSSIISQCPGGLKTPSIATFLAGSLVHIASEILGAKAKNERNKKKMADLEIKKESLKKAGDVSQKETLEQQLKEEVETEEFLADRKKWMIAVTTIYTASAGLAIAEEFYGHVAAKAANAPICSTEAAPCTLGFAGCLGVCLTNLVTSFTILKGNFAHSKAAELGRANCAKIPTYSASCLSGIEAYLKLAYGACQEVPAAGGALSLSWPKILSMAYGFGMSKVGSGGGAISQYGSMLVMLLPLVVKGFNKLVVKSYNLPIPRSITFGASAVLSGLVTSGLVVREKKAEENISKLKKVISEFKLQSEAGEAIALGLGGNNDYFDENKNKGNVKKLVINKKKECFANNGKSWEQSSDACSRSFKLSKTQFGQFRLPSINNVGSMAANMAQALANGDEAKAGSLAGEIGAYAARVKQEKDALQAAYNDDQKKNNQPTTDFDKSIKQQVAAMQGSLQQAAASNNIDLAALGSSSLDKTSEKSPEDSVVPVSGQPVVALPPADPLAGMGGTEELLLDPVAATTNEQNLDDLEIVEQDVSKQKEVSIFKQLSNRYILNYTKFFTRLKEPQAEPEAEPEEIKKN